MIVATIDAPFVAIATEFTGSVEKVVDGDTFWICDAAACHKIRSGYAGRNRMPTMQPFLGDLSTWPGLDRLSNTLGVYKILVLNKNAKPKPLCRVGGIDQGGVLYIGRSDHLRRRLNTLRRMLFEGVPRGHIAGLTYNASSCIRAIAPREQIAFWFRHCPDCRSEELSLLRYYFRKFGEVPPLNGHAGFIVPDVRARLCRVS